MTSLFDTPKVEVAVSTGIIENDTRIVEHRDITPIQILQTAVELGRNADELAKLMDLQERYERDKARKAYMAAMKACKENLPIVVRDAENTHTRSRYAKLENVSQKIDPTITSHGFSLSYGTEESNQPEHVRVICDCMHDGGHSQRYQLDCPYDTAGAKGTANKTAIQGMGSTISYGRRYLKLMIFDITVADEDNDGQDGAMLTGDQIASINSLLDALSFTDDQFRRFLTWAGAESLDKVPAKKFDSAIKRLTDTLYKRAKT